MEPSSNLIEVLAQEYDNGKISGGFVDGPESRVTYLRLTRNNGEEVLLTLRPDELAAVMWCAAGVSWSLEMSRLTLDDEDTDGVPPDLDSGSDVQP